MLFITDLHNHRIQVMSLQGEFLFTWGSRGSGVRVMNAAVLFMFRFFCVILMTSSITVFSEFTASIDPVYCSGDY